MISTATARRSPDLLSPALRGTTRGRQLRLAVVTTGAVALVPWIAYLALTLPTTYEARNWSLAWVGFDVLLLALLGATAVLGRLRHPMVGMTAFATAILLLGDAWLDWTTSTGSDHTWAVATALLVELPLAIFLLVSAVRTLPAPRSATTS